jgi:hypothetical protein
VPNRRLYVVHNLGGLTYALKLDNPHSAQGMDSTGILFSVGGNGGNAIAQERGKGGLVYHLKKTWNRGDFYFLQNSAANDANPTLSDVAMAITNDGNVGIGTATPGKKLDVRGDATVSGNETVEGDLTVSGAFVGNIGPFHGAPFPRPAYDSGWYEHPPAATQEWLHGIGGDVNNYVVDLMVKRGDTGISNWYTTSAVQWDNWTRLNIAYGAYWHHLTSQTVKVTRQSQESLYEPIYTRIRIWVYK